MINQNLELYITKVFKYFFGKAFVFNKSTNFPNTGQPLRSANLDSMIWKAYLTDKKYAEFTKHNVTIIRKAYSYNRFSLVVQMIHQ